MQQGLDYAGRSPGAAAVKAAGFSFVARYLSRYTSKVITAGEYQDMTNNGVEVVLVFEDYANQALQGYSKGVEDGLFALAQARGIGWPEDRPIHFAVDFDISDAQKPACGEYMKGVASAISLARTGAYGGYWWIKYCADNGLAAPNARWQATAWSGGMIHPTATLFQQLGGTVVNGTSCDINRQLTADFGQTGVSNVAIIQNADNWRNRCRRSFQTIRGRDMAEEEFQAYVGQDFLTLVEALEDNPEADRNVNYANYGRDCERIGWQTSYNATLAAVGLADGATADQITAAIKALTDEIAELKAAPTDTAALQQIIKDKQDQVDQLTTNLTKTAKEADDLKKQLAASQPSKLNAFGSFLMSLIKSAGLKK